MKVVTVRKFLELNYVFLVFKNYRYNEFTVFEEKNTEFLKWVSQVVSVNEDISFHKFTDGQDFSVKTLTQSQVFLSMIKDLIASFFFYLKDQNDRDVDKKRVLDFEEKIDQTMLIV